MNGKQAKLLRRLRISKDKKAVKSWHTLSAEIKGVLRMHVMNDPKM